MQKNVYPLETCVSCPFPLAMHYLGAFKHKDTKFAVEGAHADAQTKPLPEVSVSQTQIARMAQVCGS